MASLIQSLETLEPATNGSISRHGARVTTRTLNQVAGLAAGLLVAPSGTAGEECTSPTTSAAVLAGVGFSVFRPMSEDWNETTGIHYADNEAVAIMEEGHMYVLCEDTVVQDAPVFVRFESDLGSNTVLGKVRSDADTARAVALPGAFFDRSRTGPGLVEIRLNKIN